MVLHKRLLQAAVMLILTGFSLISCFRQNTDEPEAVETTAVPVQKEKILYVDSYNLDYPWIQGITRGILNTLDITRDESGELDNSKSLYDLRIFHMETKRYPEQVHIQKAALDALALIEEWKPDVIITSDDNAAKYLVVPYLMESDIPIVFCGINWDASVYGFPTQHITGMIEVNLIDKMVEELKRYGKGDRIGYIRDHSTTSLKESEHYESLLQTGIQKKFPTSFSEWKDDFLTLQKQVDMILVGYPIALEDWDGNTEPYATFLNENTRIPTGSWDQWTSSWVLLSFSLEAEEQGEYAASTAMRILDGESPSSIPVVRNQKARIFLNMDMARQLDVQFPMDLIEMAHIVDHRED
ncbi:MAG: ABC transporter substrate binding protein [Spirochaetales bacterium]|nr:ABC transporter substrate binding protein [Spirochaetales bacterium]